MIFKNNKKDPFSRWKVAAKSNSLDVLLTDIDDIIQEIGEVSLKIIDAESKNDLRKATNLRTHRNQLHNYKNAMCGRQKVLYSLQAANNKFPKNNI